MIECCQNSFTLHPLRQPHSHSSLTRAKGRAGGGAGETHNSLEAWPARERYGEGDRARFLLEVEARGTLAGTGAEDIDDAGGANNDFSILDKDVWHSACGAGEMIDCLCGEVERTGSISIVRAGRTFTRSTRPAQHLAQGWM